MKMQEETRMFRRNEDRDDFQRISHVFDYHDNYHQDGSLIGIQTKDI